MNSEWMLLEYNVLDMFIPVKLLVYLNSKVFYSSTNFNLLTIYLKGTMLSDLFSLRTVYYQFSLICIQTDLVTVLELNHRTIRERSWLMSLFIRFVDLLMWRRFVSTAKCSILLCLIELYRSLMKIINRSGSNTDFCGNPWEIRCCCELNLFTDMNWTLWVKYEWNQLLAWPQIP